MPPRSAFLRAYLITAGAIVSGSAGCDRGTGPEVAAACEPQCNLGCGMSDGCGGECGCVEGLCDGTHQCVPEPRCTQTCESLGWSCGSACGQSCGTCAAGEVCYDGGCLGATGTSCEECGLRLEVLSQQALDSGDTEVVLSLDYAPAEEAARPRIADFRLVSNRHLAVVGVAAGQGLSGAGKRLYRSPSTGEPYRIRPDGSLQLLAVSLDRNLPILPGNLLTLTVRFTGQNAAIGLQRREQVFAPAAADHALQSEPYDAPVVVMR